MKKKIQAAKKILTSYRKYKFKKDIRVKLKLLVKRKKIWVKFGHNEAIKLEKSGFAKIK